MLKVNLSVVVSVYNEEEALPLFYPELKKYLEELSVTYQMIFVNDGSVDKSFRILKDLASKDNNVKVINFSRNFGHEAAMLAGLDYSNADAVVCMDSDLQHPPSCLKEMYDMFTKGADVINMIRVSRSDGGIQKNLMSNIFYSLVNKMAKVKIEPNASDFFLLSNRAVKVLTGSYKERTRFLRGLIQMIGFNKEKLEFEAPERIAGESKYSFMKLLMFSFSAVSVLSKAPLRLGIYIGLVFAILGIGLGVFSIVIWFLGQPYSGYTTIVVLISLMFSILFFILGIMGDYIGLLFDEVKARPSYIVMDEVN